MLIIWSFIQTVALFAVRPFSASLSYSITYSRRTFLTVSPRNLRPRAEKVESCQVSLVSDQEHATYPCRRLRRSTGDENYWAPLDKTNVSLGGAILISCYRPFGKKIVSISYLAPSDTVLRTRHSWTHGTSVEHLVCASTSSCRCRIFLTIIRTSLILGILYLAFQAFPVIFEKHHGFDTQQTGLTFLGIGLGMIIGLATQPFWNKYTFCSNWYPSAVKIEWFSSFIAKESEKNGGICPPEARLFAGEVGGILIPLSK